MKRLIHFIKSEQEQPRKKREHTQITSVHNEKGPIDIKRKIRRYFKQFYANKFNIDKMEIPSEIHFKKKKKYTFLKLTHREMKKLNSPIYKTRKII